MNGDLETVTANAPVNDTIHVHVPPPLKRRRLEIPALTMRKNAQKERQEKLEKALTDIEKLINSKRRTVEMGHTSLQDFRARAIQSYLRMVVINKRKAIAASRIAAESQGFTMVQFTYVPLTLCRRQIHLKITT